MGLRIVEGRGFKPEDRVPGARATIINQSMAKRFFPNGSAIGKRWNYGGDIGPVVGEEGEPGPEHELEGVAS